MHTLPVVLSASSLALALASCDSPQPAPEPAGSARATAAAAAAARPEIVKAPDQLPSGRAWVLAELERAERDGRRVLIDVGAPWCEPCVRFHDAVASGQLDAELAGVRILELDADAHAVQLGPSDLDCKSRMIPLFARPTAEGRCGPRRVEGGIKGDGAVGFLLPKVRALLDGSG